MSILKSREVFNSKAPYFVTNRDENFLIEYDGIICPSADSIFYGLLNSDICDDFPVLRDIGKIDRKTTYYQYAFYTEEDLVRLLRGLEPDEEWDYHLSIDEVCAVARTKYHYIPANETIVWHSLVEAAMLKFVKNICIVFTRPITDFDVEFLGRLLPDTVKQKLIMVEGNILDTIVDAKMRYTTIVANSYDDIKEMISNPDKYNVSKSLFLLRNNSSNTSMTYNEETGMYDFLEIGTNDISKMLVDIRTDLPKTEMRFGRFEPSLYEDKKIPMGVAQSMNM